MTITLQKRFPPLPPALRDWVAIHEMIEQHGQKGFKKFLAEMQESTAAFQDAVTAYVDVEYFEHIRDQANVIMENAKADAEKIRDDVDSLKSDANAKIVAARENLEKQRKTDKAAHDRRSKEVQDREHESARREEALTDREKKTQVDVQYISDEKSRLAAKQTELDKHLADFEKVKALLS
jgi:hypothetical protein